MRQITLGVTGITTPQNGFGALPLQRCTEEEAVALLRRAYAGGMRFFDTARAYSNSEERLGLAFGDAFEGPEGAAYREDMFIASKTMAKTPEDFWRDLETSLSLLRTDYLDVYQLHCAPQCYRPGDGTGMYECLLEAKEQGKIRHIGITAHLIAVAEEAAESGLYETLQFPLSYLSDKRELALVETCHKNNVGFIAMKGLAGGLINNSTAAMAFMTQFENVIPIWGIQRMNELEEWLAFFDETPAITPELEAFFAEEQRSLQGEFCRGCGYCMPCTASIPINACARMSLMVRRAPSEMWLSEAWQTEMAKIDDCTDCGLCKERCPYGLDVPELLRRNAEDYAAILAGTVDPN